MVGHIQTEPKTDMRHPSVNYNFPNTQVPYIKDILQYSKWVVAPQNCTEISERGSEVLL